MEIAVLGAGSWGTALALLAARNGHTVYLLGRNEAEIAQMREHRENRHYLPGHALPPNIVPGWIPEGTPNSDLAVIAVPSAAVAEMADLARGKTSLVAIATKGLEPGTGRLLRETVRDAFPEAEVGVLSGPNLAIEIAQGIPTVALAASDHPEAADAIQAAFHRPTFRVTPTDDVVGVELAGALKNVLAIGAGMSDGLGFGDNTKGAFLSRGLMEIARIGTAMGGRMETFLGPAGVGDLFATAASRLSRNYRVGHLLAQGTSLADALASIGQVAEGVATAGATQGIAARLGVEIPVMHSVAEVIAGRLAPPVAVEALMARPCPPSLRG